MDVFAVVFNRNDSYMMLPRHVRDS